MFLKQKFDPLNNLNQPWLRIAWRQKADKNNQMKDCRQAYSSSHNKTNVNQADRLFETGKYG